MYSSIGGRVLSHYEVGTEIGKGAMGHVYKGRDVRLDRPVAIKVLPHWARGDPQARKRLLREARAASALNHPNIVTVYEIARHKGVDLMVMEYVQGKTLADLIPSRGLPVPKALGLALQMADALSAAHAAHILHRDLKPTNVMVTEDGRLKLLDFGLAQLVTLAGHSEAEQTKPDQPGTRIYMSPEQLKGHPADPRSEIFSAGLVFYQMLSGKHPFGPGTRGEVTQAIQTKPPAALPPKVPPVLANLVYRCLAPTPEQRFESMQELLAAVTECSGMADRGSARPASNRPAGAGHTPSTEVRQIRAITRRIRYKNITQSRLALTELARLIDEGASPAMREAAVSDLKDLILTLDDYGGSGVPGPVREVRKLVLELMKAAAQYHLDRYFQDRELELLDLYGMNFASCQLTGLSFRECFLVEASFQGSNLTGASFTGAWIRNANLAEADLSDADFTSADWFNALGLTEGQMVSVRRDTIMECPPTVQEMHRRLEARYGFRFESWTGQVQEELKSAWDTYLRPQGLRDAVAGWRRNSR